MSYEARALLREGIKRWGDLKSIEKVPSTTERSFAFLGDLFPEQRALIYDNSRLKAALCSRRAGKSYACCFYLIKIALEHPNSVCAYVALTRKSAKRIIWKALKRASHVYDLNLHFNNSDLIVSIPNGSEIHITGADDDRDIDKLRGNAFRLVVIDEAASFGSHIRELVEEVLEPTLVDHDGTMVLIGTPNAACTGMFYDATTDDKFGYSRHSWTIMDNPYIPHAKDWLAERMLRKNWTEHNPIYKREWKGQWVRDESSLVYRFSERNFYEDFPANEYDFEFGLGIDLGYNDPTAFIIGAFSRDLPDFYVVDEFKQSGMTPSEIAEKIREYESVYNFTYMVADTGGLGKSIVEEFRVRYSLPVRPAQKKNKFEYIELMNDDLTTGRFRVSRESGWVEEAGLLQKLEDKNIEDPRFQNHYCDAALYCWREARHYMHVPEVEQPLPGTKEYFDKLEADIWQQEQEDVEKSDQEIWWEEALN